MFEYYYKNISEYEYSVKNKVKGKKKVFVDSNATIYNHDSNNYSMACYLYNAQVT